MANQKGRSEFLSSLKRMLANWTVSEDRVKPLSDEFYIVWQEVGAYRFVTAVTKIIQDSELRYFPSVGEFRGYLPPAGKKPYCGQCNEGWVSVPDYEARSLYGNDTAMANKRCECRSGPGYQRWQQEVHEWRPGQ